MNVVVIVNDGLRVDHVGCYGSHVKAPNIDRLAAHYYLRAVRGQRHDGYRCLRAWSAMYRY